MVSTGKAISHGKAIVKYALGKKEAVTLLSRGLTSEDDFKAIYKDMMYIQTLNKKCDNNLLRIEISPHKDDSKGWNESTWSLLAEGFIKEMDVGDRQCLAVLHKDTDTPHIHLLINRIDSEGKAYSDSHLGLKCGRVAKKLSKVFGCRIAEEQKKVTSKTNSHRLVDGEVVDFTGKNRKEQKKVLRTVFRNILDRESMSSEMFWEGVDKLKKREVPVDYEILYHTDKKTGELVSYGAEICYNNEKYKASDIDKRLSGKKIFKVLEEMDVKFQQRIERLVDEKMKLSNREKDKDDDLDLSQGKRMKR